MIRSKSKGLAAIFMAAASLAAAACNAAPRTVWFAQFGETTSQWCGYRTEATWTAVGNANSTGSITLQDNGAAAVSVEWASPSGDWLISDDYSFEPDGTGSLERFGGDLTVKNGLDARYSIAGGKVLQTAHRVTDLKGDKPSSAPWIRDVEVYAKPSDLPFWPLIAALERAPDQASVCLPMT
jgi:hypothetical protein